MINKPHILVTAGLIWREDGMLLISKRPEGGMHAGCWELPGGKVEANETVEEALIREIREELGVLVRPHSEFNRVTHEYDSIVVTLVGLHAEYLSGKPEAIEVAEWRWVHPDKLLDYTYPEANARLFNCDWKSQLKS